MYQYLVTNNDGEPMYLENAYDQYEQEEAWVEEMQMRADDPMYAAMREKEEWMALATRVFEDYGIEVPYYVKEAWVREMRQLKRKNEEEKVMAKVRPLVAFLNEKMPKSEWYANYYNETPDEIAHVEVDYHYPPYKKDYINAIDEWHQKYDNDEEMVYPEDVVVSSTRFMKE